MGNLMHIFVAILGIISIISIVYCLFHGKGESHKKLLFFTSMLGAMVAISFGGEVVLVHFGMGWRCTPFNIMLLLCIILFIFTLLNCMQELSIMKNVNSIIIGCGLISMILSIFMTLILTTGYFALLSWHDDLSPLNNQMIVCARDTHGGSGSWRYYIHINNLVHGVEITQDDWWGHPPF